MSKKKITEILLRRSRKSIEKIKELKRSRIFQAEWDKVKEIISHRMNVEGLDKEPNFDLEVHFFNSPEAIELSKKYGLQFTIHPKYVVYDPTEKYLYGGPNIFENHMAVRLITLVAILGSIGDNDVGDRKEDSHYLRAGRYLPISIDILKPKNEIIAEVEQWLNYFQSINKTLKPQKTIFDRKIDKSHIWDTYNKTKSFAATAKLLNQKESTVRKAYYRAFKESTGETYDPQKHTPQNLSPKLEKDHCSNCPKSNTCQVLCPEVLSDINSGTRKYSKEKLLKY